MNDNLYSMKDEENDSVYNIEEEISDNGGEYVLAGNDDNSESCEYVIADEEQWHIGGEEYEDNDAEAWNGSVNASKPSVFGLLIKVLSDPVDGWKALKRCKYSVDSVAAGCFYPLIGLAAVSEYTALFYEADVTFSSLLVPAIITFITFFFGYFSVLLSGELLLPKEARKILHTYYGKEYVMLNISTLTVFYILFRLLPLAGPIFAFLPLWTIYVACKGVKLFRVSKENEARTCGMLSFLIVGCPVFWNWVFNEFLPTQAL